MRPAKVIHLRTSTGKHRCGSRLKTISESLSTSDRLHVTCGRCLFKLDRVASIAADGYELVNAIREMLGHSPIPETQFGAKDYARRTKESV